METGCPPPELFVTVTKTTGTSPARSARSCSSAADRFADATRPGLAMARQNETRFDMLEARERRDRLRKVGAEWRELRTPLPSQHVHRAQGVPDEQGVPRGNV